MSPVLFTIYTNECQVNNIAVILIKFPDDCSLLGLTADEDVEELYRNTIGFFTNWCNENKLLLYTDQNSTKEIIIDFWLKKESVALLQLNIEKLSRSYLTYFLA